MTEYNFLERIIDVVRTRRANCIGTALFLTGEREVDTQVHPNYAHELYVSKLVPLIEPVKGAIVTWEKYLKGGNTDAKRLSIRHAGIVHSLDPIKVIHRVRTGGIVRIQNLEGLTEDFDSLLKGTKIRYYLPRRVEEIIECMETHRDLPLAA